MHDPRSANGDAIDGVDVICGRRGAAPCAGGPLASSNKNEDRTSLECSSTTRHKASRNAGERIAFGYISSTRSARSKAWLQRRAASSAWGPRYRCSLHAYLRFCAKSPLSGGRPDQVATAEQLATLERLGQRRAGAERDRCIRVHPCPESKRLEIAMTESRIPCFNSRITTPVCTGM